MSKNDDCPTCPRPKWIAFAFETEGNEPAPERISSAGFKFYFSPSKNSKNPEAKEEVTPLGSVVWLINGEAEDKKIKKTGQYKTMADEALIQLAASPGYQHLRSEVKKNDR